MTKRCGVLQVRYLVDELESRLRRLKIEAPQLPNLRPHLRQENPEIIEQNQLLLKVLLCGAFYPNYFIQQSIDEEEADKQMCGYSNTNTVEVCSHTVV